MWNTRMMIGATLLFGLSGGIVAHGATGRPDTNKTSTARVTVSNGSLTLDDTPTFSFSNAGSSDEYRLHLAHPSPGNRVQVTDYRKQDASSSLHQQGWRLRVSTPHIPRGFRLSLSDKNDRDSSLSHSITLSSQHPTQDIMGSSSSAHASGGYGTHDIYFNGPQDATLSVPNTSPQSYQMNVDWELYTPISSDVDRG